MMTSIFIKNGIIVTMDSKRRIIRDGAIAIIDNEIVAVGKTGELLKDYGDAEFVIDAKDHVVMPGLVNTHTHFFQELGKNLGTDVNLLDWFRVAWQPIVEGMTDEDYYNAVKLACLEAIRTGTTTVLGYEHALNAHPSAVKWVIKGLKESKIRAILGYGYQDTGVEIGAPEIAIRDTQEIIHDLESIMKRCNKHNEYMLKIWLAPGTVNWMTNELIQETIRLSEEYDAGITVHMNETKAEYEYSKKIRGLSEVEYAFKKGLLREKTLAVHVVWVSDEEINLIAKTRTKVSHNPVSNMYLASGVAPVPKMLKKNITVGLATDGPASNNNHDMFDVIRVTPLLHKVANLDPLALTAEQTLEMATILGAKSLMLDHVIGSIEVGKKADIIILSLRKPNVVPVADIPSLLVYSASSENVETTIVNGEILMMNKKILYDDEEKILRNAQKSLERIIERVRIEIKTKWVYE